jgi:hypothetical protein
VFFLCVGAALGIAVAGWVAGMWTHKQARKWCPRCGTDLACPNCSDHG